MYLQIKSFDATDEAQGVFTAYANVKWHKDKANDVTIDGAFMKSIETHNANGTKPKMLLQHDYKQVCGVWLEIEEDSKGLRVKGQLAMNTTIGRETYELMKMGALDSLSIGYTVDSEKYDVATKTNYLEELTLHEISIVTFACNEPSLIDSVKSVELEPVEQEQINVEDSKSDESTVLNITNENEIDAIEQPEPELVLTQEQMAKLDELYVSIKLSQLF